MTRKGGGLSTFQLGDKLRACSRFVKLAKDTWAVSSVGRAPDF